MTPVSVIAIVLLAVTLALLVHPLFLLLLVLLLVPAR